MFELKKRKIINKRWHGNKRNLSISISYKQDDESWRSMI